MAATTDRILPFASDKEDELESEEEYGQEVAAHTTVNEMIQETIAECSTAALKFCITPAILEKARKARQKAQGNKKGQKQTSAQSGSKRKVPPETDNEEDAEEATQPTKKRCTSTTKDTNEDPEPAGEDEDEVSIPLTCYIYIERPAAPRTTKGKVSDTDKYVQKGPFILQSTDLYSTFLLHISRAAPCPILNIIEEKITWKCQTPANSPCMPLGGRTGYVAMIDAIKSKRNGQRVAIVMMPPPKKPAEKPHWDTDDKENLPERDFDYSELETSTTSDSVAQQRKKFNEATGPIVKELKEKYPIGNHPHFPGKRIYTDKLTGWNWELTELRLNLWASKIPCNLATLDRPPETKHFDREQSITTSRKGLATTVEVAPIPVLPIQPTVPSVEAVMPASTTNTSALMELMMMSMIQQQQATMNSRLQPLMPVLPTSAPETVSSAHAASAPSPFLLPDISLDDFCSFYGVEPKDKARLEKMEFRAGDDLDTLGPEDWKDFGGFMALSWSRIKAKNQVFLRDARRGLWNK